MARRAFFSFHYERDVWRASIVRNSWVTKPDREAAGFWDAGMWEDAKKTGVPAVHRLIDNALQNTSVTVVLIGAETANRPYVQYEIQKSHERGNGLLGVWIYRIEDRNGDEDSQGPNPFDLLHVTVNGKRTVMSDLYPTYPWFKSEGHKNLGSWIEAAAKKAGR